MYLHNIQVIGFAVQNVQLESAIIENLLYVHGYLFGLSLQMIVKLSIVLFVMDRFFFCFALAIST